MAEGAFFGGGPLSEGRYLGDWLKWEEDGDYSRITSALGVGVSVDIDYPSGTLLETDGATGMKIFDGTGTLLGILYNPVRVRAGETVPVAVLNKDAVIDVRGLSTASFGGLTAAQVATKIAAELSRIIVRAGA